MLLYNSGRTALRALACLETEQSTEIGSDLNLNLDLNQMDLDSRKGPGVDLDWDSRQKRWI